MATPKTGHRCPECKHVVTNGEIPVPGVTTLTYDGRKFQVPALNVRGLRWAREEQIFTKIAALEKLPPEERMVNDEWLELTARVVHTALRRNYPDLQLEEVEDMLDLSNATMLILACRGIRLSAERLDQVVNAAISGTEAKSGDSAPNE